VGLAATLLAAAAAWYLTASGRQGPAGAGDRSVAVLPFEAIGAGDPGPIAEGLHNDLLTRLSSVSGLDVISATSVERFRDSGLPLPAVAESLGVEWIVEGDVQRSGGAIQVHAQLVDADTDVHAWADTYRRELTADNLFALQGEIAGRIAGALEAELGPRERERVERRPTGDLEAYRLYARGRGLLVRRTDASMRRAEELFRRATRRDSSFAEAWAALAKALVLYPQRRGRDADSVFPPGRDAARRALELDPDLSEAHMALAVVDYYRMRGPASLRRLRRALALDPSNAMAHHGMNLLHLVFGHPGEALEHARRAVALGPMSPENQTGLALASLASGDPERGLRAARRAREIEPGYGGPFLESYALYRLGELPRPDPAGRLEIRSLLAMLAEATAGDTVPAREALRILEEERDLPPNRWTGLLQAALGRRAEALDTFEAAFRRKEEGMTGGGLTIALRYYYPDVLGPLRTDPRWQELIRRIDVGWGLNPDGSLPDSVAAVRPRPSSLMDGR
jgi:TolB-like protein/cytochrome c-type biogenesis protein CcmH/NrfG